MRRLIWVLILLWPSLTMAGVVNVEFKCTPFVGDPTKVDQVTTVPIKHFHMSICHISIPSL